MNGKKPSKWSEYDKWLKGEHLGTRSYTLTIREIVEIEMHPRQGVVESNPVMYFAETRKGLILSAHNRAVLAEMFGDDVGKCIGKRVMLRAEPMRVGGRDTLPVRIHRMPDVPASGAPAEPFESNAQADAAITTAEAEEEF